MNIIAVVVTYNRRELLKRNIACLRLNTPVSSIVVVNNGSTDGTGAWLDEQEDLTVIHRKMSVGQEVFIEAFSTLIRQVQTGSGAWTMMCFLVRTVWSICCLIPMNLG